MTLRRKKMWDDKIQKLVDASQVEKRSLSKKQEKQLFERLQKYVGPQIGGDLNGKKGEKGGVSPPNNDLFSEERLSSWFDGTNKDAMMNNKIEQQNSMENVQFMNFTGQSGIFANTFLDGNIDDTKKIQIENQAHLRLNSFNQT